MSMLSVSLNSKLTANCPLDNSSERLMGIFKLQISKSELLQVFFYFIKENGVTFLQTYMPNSNPRFSFLHQLYQINTYSWSVHPFPSHLLLFETEQPLFTYSLSCLFIYVLHSTYRSLKLSCLAFIYALTLIY